jgi:hypothetical protein
MIETAVYAKMIGDEAIADLVGTRVYPLVIPQTAALPAIAYQKISSQKMQAHDGGSHLARSRFQITLEAETYGEVKDLADAVRACWDSFQGYVNYFYLQATSIENESDTEDEGRGSLQGQAVTGLPVVRFDVMVWHYE